MTAYPHVNIETEAVRKDPKRQLVAPLGPLRGSFTYPSSPKVGRQTNSGLLSVGKLPVPIGEGEPSCQRAMSN
ncbi:hypothetical protein Mycsm_02442 [Mycobacterium sp. JS623]|nr:hypothetical protein Mycsm_02442 [Mycobacterium sp. JS623]